ncbi:7,8-didemethyl-8-hydroxy-5-deazariboflavin synthase subunit CofG [Methanobacterium subterraneum]|uniref:7,8-didemethyl-8-hydroxy-5-deazariboflavin synthase n=1 Tax=Methanobacterium subterraneum TaxID=59277 RepID=A0A2H4VR28_9EURY|nr:7,8-didemethyl-8-hydroxy-5-deazariboflavin synthase subunit CofG [Methanobacterium subterraneum]AUB60558.1 7,8-didemethyl-8-hydroxy-5-deazariboflavin synthase subunit CofG [Methanobacterium subterraneum]
MLSKEELISLMRVQGADVLQLMMQANSLRQTDKITYSKNVFLPLTNICRNDCGYCTFRREAGDPDAILVMPPSEVLKTVQEADGYECREALFTFGEQADETPQVSAALNDLGFKDMLEYLYYLCEKTLQKTSLLPHSNPGVLKKSELKMLREVNASMGLMLENVSARLMESPAHHKSPGKDPQLRIKTIENAGKLKIPFTTGLLIGIGETVEERVDSLLEIRRIQDKYGHIQEIIIQNFKSKPGIEMESHSEPSLLEMIRMVSVTKLLFPDCSVQVPPNLNRNTAQMFLLAGADDWGGVSPLTRDYVNPEAPWPELDELRNLTSQLGFQLEERLPVYPQYVTKEFLSPFVQEKI